MQRHWRCAHTHNACMLVFPEKLAERKSDGNFCRIDNSSKISVGFPFRPFRGIYKHACMPACIQAVAIVSIVRICLSAVAHVAAVAITAVAHVATVAPAVTANLATVAIVTCAAGCNNCGRGGTQP